MNKIEFPSYLAFGKLNETSIRIENECTIADYELLGKKVMEVKLSPDRAWVVDYFGGKQYASSTYPTLAQTFQSHFMVVKASSNPIMGFLSREVCNLGNFYFQHFDEDSGNWRMTFFPAGYLLVIRIPVLKENSEVVKELIEDESMKKSVFEIYETQLTINYKTGDKKVVDIHLLELVMPVAFVYDTAKWLTEHKMILKEKLFRAIISDSSNKWFTAAQLFVGNDNDDWTSYSIRYMPSASKML